jgi:hypothetical protein
MADTKLAVQHTPHAEGIDYGIVALIAGVLAAAAVVFFG